MKKLLIVLVTLVGAFAFSKINVNAEELEHDHEHGCALGILSDVSILSVGPEIYGHEGHTISWDINGSIHSAVCFTCFQFIYQNQNHMIVNYYTGNYHFIICSVCEYVQERHDLVYFYNENSHIQMCIQCNYIVKNVESHAFGYRLEGPIGTGTHIGTCVYCNYTTEPQNHIFTFKSRYNYHSNLCYCSTGYVTGWHILEEDGLYYCPTGECGWEGLPYGWIGK